MANPTLNAELTPATSDRELRALILRTEVSGRDASVPAGAQADNGDEARYADKSGTYTKGVFQTGLGLVDLAAYQTFKKALASGSPADFAAIKLGGPRTLNGPQGGLAYYLSCLDADQFNVPAAPALASDAYGAELVELYWASLLRDTAFTGYSTSSIAEQAADELTGIAAYKGPRTSAGVVTPELLFRGGYGDPAKAKWFAGETVGPYVSQFLLQGTALGSLKIDQRYVTNAAATDFMTTAEDFQKVQNGIATGKSLTPGAALYLHDGRGFAAYTHDDVLYQSYFMAYLVLSGLNTPANPGSPYIGQTTQNGFATWGGPDISVTLAAAAGEAIRAVWYQKWFVHLRHRPESGGAILHLTKTGRGNTIEGRLSDNVLNSEAVKACFKANDSYFLSQAFPEGSPTHPAYPTGHGAVAGAAITVLKFFYDGSFQIPAPVVPSGDGTATAPYVGAPLTVNGELHKLAHNISFGHGTHAGIHWRSDSDESILLGEAVAISFLRDQARTYNEKFTVSITKIDGTVVTIGNE